MPTHARRAAAPAVSLVLLACAVLGQGSPGPMERLFDGRTLTGWDGDPAIWSVRDGCIVGSTVGQPRNRNTFLVWQGGELADFELSFEVRLEGDNNSGVQYRSRRVGAEGWALHGYQCDVHPQADYFGMLYHEGGRGIVARRGQRVECDAASGVPRPGTQLFRPGPVAVDRWQRMRVIARGTRLVHEVDGVVAVEVDDPWPQAPRRGLIGLQVHSGAPMTVWFRNLELQRLPTEELALVPPAAVAAGRIWDQAPDREDAELWFRRAFVLRAPVATASFTVSCDNWCEVWINGRRVGEAADWQRPSTFDVAPFLQTGDNAIALHCRNLGGPAALAAWLHWRDPAGGSGSVVTDGEWRLADAEHEGWQELRFDAGRWAAATVTAEVPAGRTCWSTGPESGDWPRQVPLLRDLPLPPPPPPPPPPPGTPHWIWDAQAGNDEELWLRKTFDLAAVPKAAQLAASCDNHCRVYLNGAEVLRSNTWEAPRSAAVQQHLRAGKNVIAVYAANDGGPAALALKLSMREAPGPVQVVVSDPSWRVHGDEVDGWDGVGFDDGRWATATSHGLLGAPAAIWSRALGADALDGGLEDFGPQPPAPAPGIRVPPGYSVERLLAVPRGMGSWVCMAADDRGRLYASDQKAGLYRITPARRGAAEAETTVERVALELAGCQGLLWAYDSLYAVVNGRTSGLYRLRDTDGDDRLDQAALLRELPGNGEHGPHAVVLAPDGRNLLVLCGNHVRLPELARSRLPRNWAGDRLLPGIDDPNGHAVGIPAPGGYACLVDPDGREWELLCAGFRNAYDLAVAPDAAIFTFDADMEWDMGLPWYRPTRVLEVVSGGDYGWRTGSRKWPVDCPDSLPPVLDIGPSSPTGVAFGGGARWSPGHPHAGHLFCCDWTFGTVYAVALQRRGAGFHGSVEEFAVGVPLPVTDLVAGDDDDLYLVTGGRGLPSSLYRIRWSGDAAAAAAGARPRPAGDLPAAAAARHELERWHGRRDPAALAAAFAQLGSEDPFLRHAARLALESQPVADWRDRALAAADTPWAALTALVALARQGAPEDLAPVLAALGRMPVAALDEAQQLAWARVHELAFLRLGTPRWGLQAAAVAQLQAPFPTGRARVDAELCALLCHLGAPEIIERALPLLTPLRGAEPPPWLAVTERNATYGGAIQGMLRAMPPTDQIALAFALSTVRHGWTLEQRQAMVQFLQAARAQKGGASYDGYLKAILDRFWAGCTDAERAALAEFGDRAVVMPAPFRPTPPQGPGRTWRLDEAAALAQHGLKGRDFDSGRNLFHAASCAACHRFAGEGGSVGPDLTSLGNKFTARDVLEATLEPSTVISDQYAGAVLTRKDGSTLFGRVVAAREDGALVGYDVWPAVPAPEPVRVPAAEVASVELARLSPMPANLVDRLSPEELLDLLAFLLSRGDAEGPMFAR